MVEEIEKRGAGDMVVNGRHFRVWFSGLWHVLDVDRNLAGADISIRTAAFLCVHG